MRVEQIIIDGFGVFSDFNIEELTPGVTVFFGPNEAGKSTLFSFIKQVLFGFPKKSSKVNTYPPLSGGKHGGRLIVRNSRNKKYTIERYGRSLNVFSSDGTVCGQSELSNLLAHTGEEIFNNIYAFGLKELFDFETLNSEAIKDRIYSAGTGLGSISLSEVQKKLYKEKNNLYKSRGQNPEINILFNKLKTIDNHLKEIGKDAPRFEALHRELEEKNAEIKEQEGEMKIHRNNLTHVENLLKAWDYWGEIKAVEEGLELIPEIMNFPKNGVLVFEKAAENIQELSELISEKREKLDKIEIETGQLIVDDTLLKNRENILLLQKGLGKYLSAEKELPILKQKLEEEKLRLTASLQEIGPGWDENKLLKFDTSVPAKETVRKKYEILKEASDGISKFQTEIERVHREIRELEVEIEEGKENLKKHSSQVNEEKFKKQREAISNFRAKYPNFIKKEAELRHLEEKSELLNVLQLHPGQKTMVVPVWPVFIFIAFGVISLIVSGVREDWIIGSIIFGISIISAILYYVISKKNISSSKEGQDKVDTVINQEDSSQRKKKLKEELEKIKIEMLANAQICDFNSIPDLPSIDKKDRELQVLSEKLLKLDELKNKEKKLEQKLKKYQKDRNIQKEKLEEMKKDEKKAKEEWKTWLIERGLDQDLSPEGVIDIFATIKTSFEKQKFIEELKKQINKNEKLLIEYVNKVKDVLKITNRKSDYINVEIDLEKISEELEQTKVSLKRIEQLLINKSGLELELSNLEKKAIEKNQIINDLLSSGSAGDKTEFMTNALHWEEYNRLTGIKAQAEQNIKKISGTGDKYTDFINEINETTPEILGNNKLELEEKLKDIELDLSEIRESKGGIVQQIKEIEQRKEGSSLRIEKNVLMEQLMTKSKEWSVLTLARTILKKAIEKYERERQPGVIKEAQSFYSKMTLGRYSEILSPLDEGKIYVIDKTGSKKDIQDLSRGTAEQLYLSLRFGFIREFSKRSEALPIIFDDILVNFDRERCFAACEAIKDLSGYTQILYFTCHPQVVDTIKKIIPDTKVVTLDQSL